MGPTLIRPTPRDVRAKRTLNARLHDCDWARKLDSIISTENGSDDGQP